MEENKRINWEKKFKKLEEEFDNYKIENIGTKQDLVEILNKVLGIKKEEKEYQDFLYKLAHYDLVRLLKAVREIKK